MRHIDSAVVHVNSKARPELGVVYTLRYARDAHGYKLTTDNDVIDWATASLSCLYDSYLRDCSMSSYGLVSYDKGHSDAFIDRIDNAIWQLVKDELEFNVAETIYSKEEV